MALIVEDGSGVAGANAYDTLANARLLAAQQNVTLPVDDTEAETFLIRSTFHLESYRARYDGVKTHCRNQPLQFPRDNMTIDGCIVQSNEIPIELKQAWVVFASAFSEGVKIDTATGGQNIQSEKVDVLAVSYFDGGSKSENLYVTQGENILQSLFGVGSGGSVNTTTIRP